MSEHLPCPFCGGEGVACHDTQSDYKDHWSWSVECRECEAGTAGYSDEVSAWAHWDSRKEKDD